MSRRPEIRQSDIAAAKAAAEAFKGFSARLEIQPGKVCIHLDGTADDDERELAEVES